MHKIILFLLMLLLSFPNLLLAQPEEPPSEDSSVIPSEISTPASIEDGLENFSQGLPAEEEISGDSSFLREMPCHGF